MDKKKTKEQLNPGGMQILFFSQSRASTFSKKSKPVSSFIRWVSERGTWWW